MKKILKHLKENKWLHFAILIIIGIIVSIPLTQIQIRNTHDGTLHFLRIVGISKSIASGQIPPIIVSDYCNGTGYAMNLFYPQLVTFIPLLINMIVPNVFTALKIFGAICIIASGLTMYSFTYQVTKNRIIAFLAGFIYLIFPYKLVNVYKRYAIGEFTALVFMPLVFKGLYNLFNEDGKKHYYIAIGTIGMFLSHTVSTFYCAFFCLAYVLFYIKKLKDIQVLKKIMVNLCFILLICMMFYGPMIEAYKTTQYAIFDSSVMATNSEYAREHSLELIQFIHNIGTENGTTFVLGIPIIILTLLSIFTIRKVDIKYKDFYIIFALFSFISLLMCTKLFPWHYMPDFLCKLQYPWRMIGFFAFFISFICGVNVKIIIDKVLKKDILKVIVIILVIIGCVVNSIVILNQFFIGDFTKDQEYADKFYENTKISPFKINRDYLPLKAISKQWSYMKQRQVKVEILEGNATILNEENNELDTKIGVENVKEGTVFEFPYIFYPGYEVSVEINGQINIFKAIESDNGYVAFKTDKDIESANIEVKYKGTIITNISYIISLVSIVLFILYIILDKKNKIKL